MSTVAATVLGSIGQSLAPIVGTELVGRELDTWPGMTWADVRVQLQPGQFVVLPKAAIVHPRDVGAVESIGAPRGQSSDWRFPAAPDCTGLHVQSFGELWSAHVDAVHPSCGGIDHLRHDAPQLWVGGNALAGGTLGALVDRPIAGAIAGGLFGLLTLPMRRRKRVRK